MTSKELPPARQVISTVSWVLSCKKPEKWLRLWNQNVAVKWRTAPPARSRAWSAESCPKWTREMTVTSLSSECSWPAKNSSTPAWSPAPSAGSCRATNHRNDSYIPAVRMQLLSKVNEQLYQLQQTTETENTSLQSECSCPANSSSTTKVTPPAWSAGSHSATNQTNHNRIPELSMPMPWRLGTLSLQKSGWTNKCHKPHWWNCE